MNIGIDIDGVLTNDDDYILDCSTKFCYEKGLKLFDDPYQYEWRKFDWNLEILNEYRKKYFFWKYVDEEPARKFASEIIKKLKDDGHNIYIITGRHKATEQSELGEMMREKIKNWLENNDIIYDELVFTVTPKIPDIEKRKIDIMIEDSPETIPLISEITHVFCFDARYNRNLECNNMTRVFSWYDIYMKINEYEKL